MPWPRSTRAASMAGAGPLQRPLGRRSTGSHMRWRRRRCVGANRVSCDVSGRDGGARCGVHASQSRSTTMNASRLGLRWPTARVAATLCGLAAACAVMVWAPLASAASPNLYAVVDAAGTQLAGNGVAGITHLGPGRYEVTFTQNVSQCSYVATTKNAFSQAIQVFTAGGHISPLGVYVETKNQGGGLTDGPFNLVVDCGTTGMQFAVIDYAGQLARGTVGTTVTNLGTG